MLRPPLPLDLIERLKGLEIEAVTQKSQASSDPRSKEMLHTVSVGFNRSFRVDSHVDCLTDDPGTVLFCEMLERIGIVSWMTARLNEPRRKVEVTGDLASLTRTFALLSTQGWRDYDDTDGSDARRSPSLTRKDRQEDRQGPIRKDRPLLIPAARKTSRPRCRIPPSA